MSDDTTSYGANVLRAVVREAPAERPERETERHERASEPLPSCRAFELLGNSPSMRALQASVSRVASSTAPVLITGETGAGKDLVARTIHARSARRRKPLVAVNTASVADDFLESEVFGHVRGAFPFALQPRNGLVLAADGGTLFLDEIGDMPLRLQAKLLRVLQFGEVRAVGSDRSSFVDVRVIAATHCDLPRLVREGRFREDLYFRLNVLPVFVPPLRARREDIPALAQHFFAEARERTIDTPVLAIGDEAVAALCEADWPGNIRELASAIERAVVFATDAIITADHLSLPTKAAASPVPWSDMMRSPWTLERLTDAYTAWVLGQAGGDKRRAAEILGVDLSTLYRWIRAHRG